MINLIGASTGGVAAVCEVLRYFGAATHPTVIIQHTGPQFGPSLASVLQRNTKAKVLFAPDHQPPIPLHFGHVYVVAGCHFHSTISAASPPIMSFEPSKTADCHVPSIDTLFSSAVPFATRIVAALLSGMGRDGAHGLKELKDHGASTFVQDEETSVVYGMPRVAWEIGASEHKLPIGEIGPAMIDAGKRIIENDG